MFELLGVDHWASHCSQMVDELFLLTSFIGKKFF